MYHSCWKSSSERAVLSAVQLNDQINKNHLLPRYQSALKQHHSTETAMLRVVLDATICSAWHAVNWLCRPRSYAPAAGSVTLWSEEQRTSQDGSLQIGVTGHSRLCSVQHVISGRLQWVSYAPQSLIGLLLFISYTANLSTVVRCISWPHAAPVRWWMQNASCTSLTLTPYCTLFEHMLFCNTTI